MISGGLTAAIKALGREFEGETCNNVLVSYVPSMGTTANALPFFFSRRRRHTSSLRDWSSDVCSSDLLAVLLPNGTSPLAGTETDGRDETRGYMALDWLLRTFAPAWLDLAGLAGEASALRDFRRVADLAAAQAIRQHVDTASAKASAAWDAAWAAAGAAAGAAAWDAAGAAAWDAAGAAAGAAAWAAAGAAAGAAAWAAA